VTLTAPKQAPCLSSKRLLYLAWAVYTCEVYPILFCLHVHPDAKCLQPDIRVSTLNSSAGKLAIAQEGDRIAGSSADACSLQPCRSQAAMGIAILSVADTKLCIDKQKPPHKDGNPTWLYQFKGSVAQQWNFVPRMDGLQSDCLKRGDDRGAHKPDSADYPQGSVWYDHAAGANPCRNAKHQNEFMGALAPSFSMSLRPPWRLRYRLASSNQAACS